MCFVCSIHPHVYSVYVCWRFQLNRRRRQGTRKKYNNMKNAVLGVNWMNKCRPMCAHCVLVFLYVCIDGVTLTIWHLTRCDVVLLVRMCVGIDFLRDFDFSPVAFVKWTRIDNDNVRAIVQISDAHMTYPYVCRHQAKAYTCTQRERARDRNITSCNQKQNANDSLNTDWRDGVCFQCRWYSLHSNAIDWNSVTKFVSYRPFRLYEN